MLLTNLIMGVLKFLLLKLASRWCPSNKINSVGFGIVDQEGEERFSPDDGDMGRPAEYYVGKWEEIVKATQNFSVLIGSGGFGNVYSGCLWWGSSSRKVAVKVVGCGTGRLRLALKHEVEVLLQIRHENIVKFLGYCFDKEDEGVLIFEYISNGTLEEKLQPDMSSSSSSSKNGHHRHRSSKTLSWKNRVKIAFQLVQAIEYLHKKSIIHGDIKPSNILLDSNVNCKLCDFGSAKLEKMAVCSSTLNRKARNNIIMGSPGYADPEYLRTGMASEKNDIYGFGIVLLELVTGLVPFDMNGNVRMLTCSEDIIVIDPRLRGAFDIEEAKNLVKLARLCVHESAVIRPSSAYLMKIMSQIIC